MDKWLEYISTYGISFVGIIALALYVVKKDKEHAERVDKMAAQHHNEIKEIQEKQTNSIKEISTALNNNTLAITRLCERLGSTGNGGLNDGI